MQKSKEKLSTRLLLPVLGAALLVLIPLRCYQFKKLIDPVSGFYSSNDWSVWISYAMIVLTFVIFSVFAFMLRKSVTYISRPQKSVGLALASFLLAVTLIICSLVQFERAFVILSEYTYSPQDDAGAAFFKTGIFARIAESVCAIVSAVYFTLFGYGHISGKSTAADSRLMALFPVLWCIFRLMHRFMRTVNFLNVSELVYEMFMCVLLSVFFMAFAQLNSNVNVQKGSSAKLLGIGLSAAMMCLVCFLPRFIMSVTGNAALLCADSPIEWCDLGCAVFIIALTTLRIGFFEQREEVSSADDADADDGNALDNYDDNNGADSTEGES